MRLTRLSRLLAGLLLLPVAAMLVFIGIAVGQTPPWLVYSPLPFLFLLMGTGLYMFARPYFVRRGATG